MTHVPTPGRGRREPLAALLGLCLAHLAPAAHAQVLDALAAEVTGWQAVFDASFVPVAIAAGLLLALVVFCFSRFAGAAVAFFVIVGAFMYGARDVIQGFAA